VTHIIVGLRLAKNTFPWGFEWALGSLQFFERREDFISNSRHKPVLHLGDEDESLRLLDTIEQP
jgi:hypothetical protein